MINFFFFSKSRNFLNIYDFFFILFEGYSYKLFICILFYLVIYIISKEII